MSGVDGGGLSAEERDALDVMGMFPTPAGLANPAAWERETEGRLSATVERIVAARVAAAEQIAERESAIAVAREHHRMVAFVEAAERERDDQIEKVRRLDADYQRLAEESRQDAAALAARARAEGEVAGQMKHITAEVVRGDQTLDEKEEFIADLRARLSHVEAQHDAAEQRAERVTAAVRAVLDADQAWSGNPDEAGQLGHAIQRLRDTYIADLATADPAPREYDDGGPRVREAVERAERDAEVAARALRDLLAWVVDQGAYDFTRSAVAAEISDRAAALAPDADTTDDGDQP